MSGKLFLVILFIYVTLTFLGSTFEEHTTVGGDWAGNVEATSTLDFLFDIKNMTQKLEVLGFETPIPIPNGEWFSTAFQVMTLRFSFIVDNYEMVWWIVLMPIAMMGLLSMVLLGVGIVRGNISWS